MDVLDRLRKAGEQLRRAEDEVEAAVREAHEQGLALRRIGEAVGRNHEWVRLLLLRGRPYVNRKVNPRRSGRDA